MNGSAHEHPPWSSQPRPYWLPPIGRGNGLEADAWAPIADLDATVADDMLAACRSAGIAAFAASARGGRPRSGVSMYRIWVDSARFGAAEDVLRRVVGEADLHGP